MQVTGDDVAVAKAKGFSILAGKRRFRRRRRRRLEYELLKVLKVPNVSFAARYSNKLNPVSNNRKLNMKLREICFCEFPLALENCNPINVLF